MHPSTNTQGVRKPWQIDGSKIQLTNPEWEPAFKALVSKVATEMKCGGHSAVEAHLYKLLLYEPGGFFKSHRDTEKEPGMFGTMVGGDKERE